MFGRIHMRYTDLLISILEHVSIRAVHCRPSTSALMTRCASFFTCLGRRLALTSFPRAVSLAIWYKVVDQNALEASLLLARSPGTLPTVSLRSLWQCEPGLCTCNRWCLFGNFLPAIFWSHFKVTVCLRTMPSLDNSFVTLLPQVPQSKI